ncbi:uncharacterized protein XM38_006200 [Halomicronema hongdechloris C2206]|uniref:TPM domain-containing protein n=1 Tax=Halomicronema hongdechloris C2206 TaxID=1641165 RepID=A0A1Z3HHB9_9CYAN|nr:TPM domain-containing protein [Halomicronema hongdechloris]ASC69691.1 uncharacterized protein XM38_006200 [Halomicronema hongdechloris C2206]
MAMPFHHPWQWLRIVTGSLVWALGVAGLLWVASPAYATGVYQMPDLSAGEDTWIIDDANQISRLNEGKISTALSQLATETGYEVRLVTLHRLDYGETAQTFTDELFQTWFPTPDEQANQVLLVLDDVTNSAGIRVGAAVAETLTPDTATSIAEETAIVPLLEDNKYNQALLDVVDRVVPVLSGEADPGPPVFDDAYDAEGTFATAEETDANRSNAIVWVIGLLIAATVIPMATYYLYLAIGN